MGRGMPPHRFAEILRERLSYDPMTGKITHRLGGGRHKPGDEAGSMGTNGYRFVKIKIDGQRFTTSAQRVAWIIYHGQEPDGVIDHIDRNRLNNAIDNLQDISQSRNLLRGKRKTRDLPRGVSLRSDPLSKKPYAVQFKRSDGGKHRSFHATVSGAESAFRSAFHQSYGAFPEEI